MVEEGCLGVRVRLVWSYCLVCEGTFCIPLAGRRISGCRDPLPAKRRPPRSDLWFWGRSGRHGAWLEILVFVQRRFRRETCQVQSSSWPSWGRGRNGDGRDGNLGRWIRAPVHLETQTPPESLTYLGVVALRQTNSPHTGLGSVQDR